MEEHLLACTHKHARTHAHRLAQTLHNLTQPPAETFTGAASPHLHLPQLLQTDSSLSLCPLSSRGLHYKTHVLAQAPLQGYFEDAD